MNRFWLVVGLIIVSSSLHPAVVGAQDQDKWSTNVLQLSSFYDYLYQQENALFPGNYKYVDHSIDLQIGLQTGHLLTSDTNGSGSSISAHPLIFGIDQRILGKLLNKPSANCVESPAEPKKVMEHSRIGRFLRYPISQQRTFCIGDFYADKCYWGRGLNNNLEHPCHEIEKSKTPEMPDQMPDY